MIEKILRIAGTVIVVAVVLLVFIVVIVKVISKDRTREKIEKLAENNGEVTPEELLELKQATLKTGGGKTADDFVGVYIICNQTQELYYVGQAKKVLLRASSHFEGHGNGDIYADYKYGDRFRIKTIALSKSGYDSLDRLEKDTIETYGAYDNGYNRTRGNE